MKYMSWNVNGIRAVLKKDFREILTTENPDVIWFQETKGRPDQLTKADTAWLEETGYHQYWNPAERPGYSGTAVFSKKQALSVYHGINPDALDTSTLKELDEVLLNNHEWRVVTLEFEDHYYITVYTPNSKDDLARLDYRFSTWDKAFLQYLKHLEKSKPVIACWDLNVAHRPIDLARPKQNTMSAGFTKEEREWMDNFIDAGLLDTFRLKYPELEDKYTWWSYRAGARARNVGWRIDYFLISQSLESKLIEAKTRDDILWSDHCPVEIEINL
jgi:exodeoxyribonuclease-3